MPAAHWRLALRPYYELTKPGIAGFVTILAGVSFYVGSRGRADLLPMMHTLLGTALATAGALALNQYAEREVDARMTRTRTRPLPSGRMEPREALGFGALLLAVGVGYLGGTVGWLPALLTALSAAAYLLAYTPLKSRSYLATLVGAVPGAFPALIGWTAATGRIELGAMVLFGIAFLWQLPHVLALAWLLREDYARVGFFLSPPTDANGARIGRHMVYHSVSLLGLSVFPTLLGITGRVYLAGAIALALAMLTLTGCAALRMTSQRARRVFLFSLLYQPFLMVLLLLDTVRLVTPSVTHRFRLPAFVVFACCVLGAPALAQAPTPPADALALRFAWPVGTEAKVMYTKVIEREEGGPASRLEIAGEYVVHVHEHPSGLMIEHLEPLATRFQADPSLASDDPRRVVYSSLGALNADWVISTDGELLGVAGLPVVADAVAATLLPLGLDTATIQAAIGELASEAPLMAIARDLWRGMVGAWANLDLAVGETVTSTGEEANPLVPSVVLPYLHEYTLSDIEACAAPGGLCARLELVSFPDPRELTRVMSEALQQMGLGTLSFERLVQLTRVTLLADPDTLLPHELVFSKSVDGILVEDGERRIFRRGDQTRLAFTY